MHKYVSVIIQKQKKNNQRKKYPESCGYVKVIEDLEGCDWRLWKGKYAIATGEGPEPYLLYGFMTTSAHIVVKTFNRLTRDN